MDRDEARYIGMSTPILFEDIFEVVKRDPDGKKFDKGTQCL